MKTLKDKGSEYYKQKNYPLAIQSYKQYLKTDNPEHDKTLFNIALCYQLLNQHQKAVQYYQTCIQKNNKYTKAYYRLTKQYRHINGDQSYNIFITAYNFLQYADIVQYKKQRQQIQKIMNQYKTMFNIMTNKPTQACVNQQLCQFLKQKIPKIQQQQTYNIQIDKQPQQWITQWKQQVQSDDAKWQQIKYILQENYQYGLNLAYFYINQVMPVNLKQARRIEEQLKKIKKEKNVKSVYDNNERYQRRQETEEERQDLQNRLDNFHFDRMSKKDETMGGRLKSKKLQYFSSMSKVKQTPQQQQKSKKQLQQKTQASKKVLQQIKQNAVLSSSDTDIQTLYTGFCGKIQTSKDKFRQTYTSIMNILNGSQKMQRKGQLLILMKKRLKKLKFIISSFSNAQQQKIYNQLVKNKMEEYANDFAPLFYKEQ